jgi:hypothetical protein
MRVAPGDAIWVLFDTSAVILSIAWHGAAARGGIS